MMSAILGMCEGATEIVQRPISANPGLNFYPGMFFFSSKVFSLAIFSSNFLYSCKSGQSSNCRQKRIQLNLLSKLLYLISNFALTLGYLNPTLNSPAQSYNPTSHKATTIRTLTRRAQLVCDSPDSLQDETDYLNNGFSKNNYNTDFVRRNTHSNTYSNTKPNVHSGPVTTATIPYIRSTFETIACILQPYNIRVAHKPITTIRRLLTNVKVCTARSTSPLHCGTVGMMKYVRTAIEL